MTIKLPIKNEGTASRHSRVIVLTDRQDGSAQTDTETPVTNITSLPIAVSKNHYRKT